MLDVVIALKDRDFRDCIKSLLEIKIIKNIIICNGGSQQVNVLSMLDLFSSHPKVKILDFPSAKFNKSQLLNKGILYSKSPLLIISDADIIWNSKTVECLYDTVKKRSKTLCTINTVYESKNIVKLNEQSQSYTYNIRRKNKQIILTIYPVIPNFFNRSGCGLVCGYRKTFLKLGGYREDFKGWGWEDQDFLIRAEILGFKIAKIGSVIHQSHGDILRNQFHEYKNHWLTRNSNIQVCLNGLKNGVFHGSIPKLLPYKQDEFSLEIHLPKNLITII